MSHVAFWPGAMPMAFARLERDYVAGHGLAYSVAVYLKSTDPIDDL